MLLLIAAPLWAADSPAAPYEGRRVSEVIDEFRDAGYPFAYSTNLVTADLTVIEEPQPGSALAIVAAILKPHGLAIRTESDVHLVVRDSSAESAAHLDEPDAPQGAQPSAALENVVVSASRYAISRDIAASGFSIDQRTIQNLPDLGEDPIRVTQRLPGAAASGASAVAHFRGGDADEVGIMLNGQWLFDPFHIRDYQNVFSAIDARAIRGVEVYTGGFPVRYGDRMSGLVLMDTIELEKDRHHEIGISVFNTSLLSAGKTGNRRWVASVRRGNLDLVIDPKFGQPSYFDAFAEFTIDLTPYATLSFNALYADDAIDLVLETEPTERDEVSSQTQNAQFWAKLDNRWSDTLSSTTVVSAVDYRNRRTGFANDEEKMVATVSDNRKTWQIGFRQDWVWSPNEKRRMQWGISGLSGDAEYDYVGNAEYFGLQALYAGRPLELQRAVRANPEGGSYAVYLSDRRQITDRLIAEWGLRWDDQTYTDLASDSQLSPRMNLLYRLGKQTDLRVSAGRYFQSQSIQALQVEDGITRFWPAQRADHLILGLRHQFGNDLTARVELFHKAIGRVRPRFENLFDPLGLMPELQQDRVRLDPSSAKAEGVELSADQTVGDFSWWASYTWSDVSDEIDNIDVPRSWDQRHSLQAGIDFGRGGWNFSAAASVHSGWPTTELRFDANGFVEPEARNARQHGTYASLDARVSRKFDVRRGSLLVFVEVSNLLNRRNACCLDWDIGEDAAGNDILERGQDYWMPLLPAVGILWEF